MNQRKDFAINQKFCEWEAMRWDEREWEEIDERWKEAKEWCYKISQGLWMRRGEMRWERMRGDRWKMKRTEGYQIFEGMRMRRDEVRWERVRGDKWKMKRNKGKMLQDISRDANEKRWDENWWERGRMKGDIVAEGWKKQRNDVTRYVVKWCEWEDVRWDEREWKQINGGMTKGELANMLQRIRMDAKKKRLEEIR